MRLSSLCLPGLLFSALTLPLLLGCTSNEEKINRMLQEHLDRCKKSDTVITEIKLFDGTTEPMLVEACSQPVTELVIDSGIEATAKTGPYSWTIVQNPESGVWIASGLEWNDFHTAMRILDDGESDDAVLAGGVTQITAAEAAFPESAYVRARRLELLLKLRKVMRSKAGQDDPNGLGKDAQAYYDDLLAWSDAQQNKALPAEARVMVITYVQGLNGFLDMSLDSLGSRDDVLRTSIKEAEKEKDTANADIYRKELEDSIAERPAQIAGLEARKAAVKALLCKEAAALDPQGITDDEIKERAVALKSSIDCTATP